MPGLPPLEKKTNGSSELQHGAGRVAREDNKLKLVDRAAHQWYRFVLSFPPHLVREYVAKFGLNSHHRVLDPVSYTHRCV